MTGLCKSSGAESTKQPPQIPAGTPTSTKNRMAAQVLGGFKSLSRRSSLGGSFMTESLSQEGSDHENKEGDRYGNRAKARGDCDSCFPVSRACRQRNATRAKQ